MFMARQFEIIALAFSSSTFRTTRHRRQYASFIHTLVSLSSANEISFFRPPERRIQRLRSFSLCSEAFRNIILPQELRQMRQIALRFSTPVRSGKTPFHRQERSAFDPAMPNAKFSETHPRTSSSKLIGSPQVIPFAFAKLHVTAAFT